MNDTYDHSFGDEAVLEFYQSVIKSSDFQTASMQIEGDFSAPPLRESFQLVSRVKTPGESLADETFVLRDKIAKSCVLKKNVSFLLDGKVVGNLTVLTDVNQDLNADIFLRENPLFYQLLLEDTTAFVLKNLRRLGKTQYRRNPGRRRWKGLADHRRARRFWVPVPVLSVPSGISPGAGRLRRLLRRHGLICGADRNRESAQVLRRLDHRKRGWFFCLDGSRHR